MLNRSDITGFTIKVFGWYIEFVFYKKRLATIALNYKKLTSNTYYLLDRNI